MSLLSLGQKVASENVADVDSTNNGILKKAALFTIDKRGNINKDKELAFGVFLLNPSTWEESKSSNWSPQNVPGQSDPVLQWVNSGPRTVSFDALVTADTSDFVSGVQFKKPGEDTSTIGKIKTFVSDIAGAFFNVSFPKPRVTQEKSDAKGDKLDISNYLNYYRSLLYPVYDSVNNPTRLRNSPPLVVLYTGNSINKIKYGNNRISSNSDIWVVTNLRIRITKQLPNLAPMEATVSFQLTQYNIKSFSRGRFLNQAD